MTIPSVDAPASGFFLSGGVGRVFCMYHAPHTAATPIGQLLVIPPFAEEMNKSRRMLALLARACAHRGVGTMLLDLYGTGESDGDFGEARWEIWKQDVAAALAWLHGRTGGGVRMLGVRLGALLALDVAGESERATPVSMWQPTLSGAVAITQFLRMRMVSSLTRTGSSEVEGTDGLRRRLDSGQPVEVAGYELHPQLARKIDDLRLEDLASVRAAPIRWFELASEPGRGVAPASRRALERLQERGIEVHETVIAGPPFFSSVEIAEAPTLIEATCASLDNVEPI